MSLYLSKLKSIATTSKYTNWYCAIIEKAILRGNNKKNITLNCGYVEKHHIFPKSFTNENVDCDENFVYLTAKEHFIVHLLATKMFNGKFSAKMNYAFRGMISSKNIHQSSRYVSRLYSYFKAKIKIHNNYTKLYKLDVVKWIHNDDAHIIEDMMNSGWTTVMTPEYKVGRVGNNRGKHQTEYQKAIVSKLRRKEKKIKQIYFLDITTKIDIRSDILEDYISQGWSLNITREFRSTQSIKTNKHMRSDARKRAAMRISASFATRDLIICPHCGKSSKVAANMHRWHFTNCKLNPDRIATGNPFLDEV